MLLSVRRYSFSTFIQVEFKSIPRPEPDIPIPRLTFYSSGMVDNVLP